jgi:uncharacterized membrane protein
VSSRAERKLRRQLSLQRKQLAQVRSNPPSLHESVLGGVTQVNHSVTTSYVGPIPPPSMMREFDELVPGAAARILQLAEDQTRHRMSLEKLVVNSNNRRAWCGLAAGLFVTLSAIGCGTYLVVNGFSAVGFAFGISAVAGLSGVFVYGTRSGRKERVEKAKLMTGHK